MLGVKKKIDDVVENYKFVSPESIEEAVQVGRLHQTVFALGCFWGPDANLGGIPGVVQTRVGYAGSSTLDPSYDDIQGHAEVVRVVFDNELISYRDLLGDFQTWFVPGESQGQYRPILFVFNKEQKLIAEELVLSIGKKNSPEVIEAGTQKGYFWDAEEKSTKKESFFKLIENPQISKTLAAIHNSLEQKWSLEDLAEIAGMSRTNYSVKFKELSGMTPLDYLTYCRLDKAKQLLTETSQSVPEVSEAIGYPAHEHFQKLFKKKIGKTPSAYRKENSKRV